MENVFRSYYIFGVYLIINVYLKAEFSFYPAICDAAPGKTSVQLAKAAVGMVVYENQKFFDCRYVSTKL